MKYKIQSRNPLIALGLLALAAVLPVRADYPSTVLSQGPVTYWRLNSTATTQPSITTATNVGSLGFTDNGTYYGGQGFFRGATGALASSDTGITLDGSSQYVQTGAYDAALNPAANFTVETWVAPALIGAAIPGGLTCAISCGDFASPRAGWLIYQSTTGWNLRMYNQNGTATSLSITANTNMVAGTYYHLVVTFDGTTAKMYVNGVLLASGSPVSGNPAAAPSAYVPGIAGNFSIGTRSDKAFYWAGQEDEVAFYPSVLSANTIAAHYSAATTNAAGYASQVLASSPLLYYRLDEAGDPFIPNSGSLGNAGAGDIVYPALTGAAGPQPSAFPGFESTNTALDLSTGGYMQARPLNLNTNGFTITCWLQPSGGQVGYAGAVMQRASTAAGGAYSSTAGLVFDAAGGLNLSYNWDGDASTFNWYSGVSLNDGAWNFVALIIQSNQAVLFSPNGASQFPSTNYATHAPLKFEGTTYLGLDPYSGLAATTRTYVGAIDEVAVFQRSLSLGEVYTQYGAAAGNVAPMVFSDPQAPAYQLYAGDALQLVVDAGGTPGFTYQWRKNGGAISGATTSVLSIPSLATTDQGNYDVVIHSSFGTATSAAAFVGVPAAVKPIITQDLAVTNRTIYTGGVISLGVTAVGGGVTYQWQNGATPLAGKTAATLTITGVTPANAGLYSVVASNGQGSTTSAVANLAVGAPASGSYAAVVAGDAPVSWWRLDDAPNALLMLDSMGRADGYYTNLAGSITLGVGGALNGDANTAAHFDLANQSWGEVPLPPVSTGDYTLEAWVRTTNSGTALVPVSSARSQYGEFFERGTDGNWHTYEGYGQLDGGAFRQETIGPSVSGQWMHIVTTFAGAVGAKSYINGVWDGGGPYVDYSRNLNTPLRIGAVGPYPGGLQLFMDGEVDEVAFYNKALSDAQILKHYQTGLFSGNTVPFFTQQPASQQVVVGSAVSFTATAQGSPTITYQWFKNGTAVSGATSTVLSVASVGFATNVDTYILRAVNPAGTTFSSPATVRAFAPNPAFINATNGLVLHLKFDGDYSDASGRGNSGTAVGTPVFGAGKIGSGALTYNTDTANGIYNYVTLGTPTDLLFGTNVNFSVAYWVQLTAGELSGDLPFLGSALSSYGNAGFTFAPSYKLGGWSYSLNGVAQLYGPNNSINNGNWHHLVHSFDRTGFGVTYLDGVQVDSRLVNNIGNIDSGNSISIGQDPSGTYGESGTATIDDLSVWRRAVTAYEVYAMYYVGNTYGKSIDSYGPVSITQTIVNGNIQFNWPAGTLQSATNLLGPWTNVAGASAPFYQAPIGTGTLFYRIKL